ncbi:MAG: MATE family efflux transporter, partial [Campylobacteraceae bacterium]|nr:MATE family efflux transporter [Campylobacteraceae bacterium]
VALHISASVVVGNCLGAKRVAEARRIAAILAFSGAAVMSVVAGILWWFMSDLAAFMSDDDMVQFYIAEYLKYNFLSTPFSIISTIFAGVMIGASAAHFNLLIFGLSFWVIRIPLAYVLGHFVWGEATGVFVAMLISQAIQTALMLYVFYKLDWTKYALKKS